CVQVSGVFLHVRDDVEPAVLQERAHGVDREARVEVLAERLTESRTGHHVAQRADRLPEMVLDRVDLRALGATGRADGAILVADAVPDEAHRPRSVREVEMEEELPPLCRPTGAPGALTLVLRAGAQ